MDVQLTADRKLAVFHDDFLSDFTCLHSLTLEQLQASLPYVPELHEVLKVARHFNRTNGDTLDVLQLLNPAQIEAVTGLPVTIISKKISLGLTWADIGPVYRLPGYASPGQFLATAMAVRSRAVGGEMDFFGPAEQLQRGSFRGRGPCARAAGVCGSGKRGS